MSILILKEGGEMFSKNAIIRFVITAVLLGAAVILAFALYNAYVVWRFNPIYINNFGKVK